MKAFKNGTLDKIFEDTQASMTELISQISLFNIDLCTHFEVLTGLNEHRRAAFFRYLPSNINRAQRNRCRFRKWDKLTKSVYTFHINFALALYVLNNVALNTHTSLTHPPVAAYDLCT